MYLTVSLLGMFSSALLGMSGSEIKMWLERISSGAREWFKAIPLSSRSSPRNWKEFCRGWMAAAEALKKNTPTSFQKAITETEIWAASAPDVADTDDNASSSRNLDAEQMSPTDSNASSSSASSFSTSSASAAADMTRMKNNSETVSSSSSASFFDRMRRASVLIQEQVTEQIKTFQTKEVIDKYKERERNPRSAGPTPTDTASYTASEAPSGSDIVATEASNWLHDRISGSVCIWIDPEEVVPCLCSNRRRPVLGPRDVNIISESFDEAVDLVRSRYALLPAAASSNVSREHEPPEVLLSLDEKDHIATVAENTPAESEPGQDNESCPVCFPPRLRSTYTSPLVNEVQNSNDSKPFYFGIDCRSDEEKKLGKFPKAFDMDANFITDSEAVIELLETLQPLANAVHLCIIGAGEAYIRRNIGAKYNARKKSVLDWPEDEREREKNRDREIAEADDMVIMSTILSHPIPSHPTPPIPFHSITSHHIPSHPISSHLIPSHSILFPLSFRMGTIK